MYSNRVFNNDYPVELLEFYQRQYPLRDAKKYVDYILKSTPYKDVFSSSVIGYSDDEIKAEIFSIIGKCHFAGKSHYCIFGCDYIVSIEQRNSPLGAAILRKLMKNRIHFAIGPKKGSTSYKLHSIYGEKHFTDCGIFIAFNWRHPFSIIRDLAKVIIGRNSTMQPENQKRSQINMLDYSFELIGNEQMISSSRGYQEKWMEDDVFEFDRSAEYLRWRFFRAPHDYSFYEMRNKTGELEGYAVFRPIRFRWFLSTLTLVDYRFRNKAALKAIMKFAVSLLNQSKLPFLLVSNSLSCFSRIYNQFYRIYYYPVLTNFPEVNSIRASLITLADADGELNKID